MSDIDNHENEDSGKNEEAEETASESTEETNDEQSEGESHDENNEDKVEDEADDSDEEEEGNSDYRPKSEQPKETVPLKKHLKLKKELARLKKEREDDGEDLSTKDLDSLAEEYGLAPKALKELANTISTMTLKQAEKIIAPIQAKAIEAENERAFNTDFEIKILKQYPHLASKKEQFKKIAFSPDFVHLKTLEDIRNEFFSDVTPKKKKETDAPEGGSRGSTKVEEIDFDHMTEEQHLRVLADPVLKKKLYEHQDAQGL